MFHPSRNTSQFSFLRDISPTGQTFGNNRLRNALLNALLKDTSKYIFKYLTVITYNLDYISRYIHVWVVYNSQLILFCVLIGDSSSFPVYCDMKSGGNWSSILKW